MEEFFVSIFWENKKEEVIEVTPGHMRVSMEELGRKQQSCFQIPAGSTTCASQTCLYSPIDVRITTQEHCFHEGDGKGGCVYSSITRKSTILCQKLNFLISVGVQGFEP